MRRIRLEQTDYGAWVTNQEVVLNDNHELVRLARDGAIALPGERIERFRDFLKHKIFTNGGGALLLAPNNKPVVAIAGSPFAKPPPAKDPGPLMVKTEVGVLEWKSPEVCYCKLSWIKDQGEGFKPPPDFAPEEHHAYCIFKNAEVISA